MKDLDSGLPVGAPRLYGNHAELYMGLSRRWLLRKESIKRRYRKAGDVEKEA